MIEYSEYEKPSRDLATIYIQRVTPDSACNDIGVSALEISEAAGGRGTKIREDVYLFSLPSGRYLANYTTVTKDCRSPRPEFNPVAVSTAGWDGTIMFTVETDTRYKLAVASDGNAGLVAF